MFKVEIQRKNYSGWNVKANLRGIDYKGLLMMDKMFWMMDKT